MRYLALATDYDGTLAHEGVVDAATLAALRRLKESGRRAILVTGRELNDLRVVFPELAVFDRIVTENGAQVFTPETGEELLLGPPPPEAFVQRLREQGVPLSVGRVIVATWEPHQHTVLAAIKELGLELQVIFNKGAVMVLPSGINKASGLAAALKELSLSPHNTVGVGDAENDHALVAACEVGVAVANALPMLKEHADWTTSGARGEGVTQLIDALIENDLGPLADKLTRRDLPLSQGEDKDRKVSVSPYGSRILLCGTSGSGKSTLATSFIEQLILASYQFCLIDPEGDYDDLQPAVALGNEQQAPKASEVLQLLSGPDNSAVVNLLGLPMDKRAGFFSELSAQITELRSRTGRPHWVVVDEAHHMLPQGDELLTEPVLGAPPGLLLITVHPERLSPHVLAQVDTVLVVGDAPDEMFASFAQRVGIAAPQLSEPPLTSGEALCWRPGHSQQVQRFQSIPPRLERRRHRRKYATGELGEDKSFFFRGPQGRLNLRAQNLQLFLQMADGVDAETWLHHLTRHDYSRWVREAIKNDGLASEIEAIETTRKPSAELTRKRVREAIDRVYTLPA